MPRPGNKLTYDSIVNAPENSPAECQTSRHVNGRQGYCFFDCLLDAMFPVLCDRRDLSVSVGDSSFDHAMTSSEGWYDTDSWFGSEKDEFDESEKDEFDEYPDEVNPLDRF